MIRVRTLGKAVIEIGDTVLTPTAETLFATALYLALEGRAVTRHDLARLIWPDATERAAQHCLRQALYKLNAFGAGLRSDRTRIVVPARSVSSDVAPVLSTKGEVELEAVADCIEGGFLPGYAPQFSLRFAEWVERKRDVVHSALRRVFMTVIAARRRRGEWRKAEHVGHRCLAIDPLNEEATLSTAEALALLGNKVQALALLDRYLREIGGVPNQIRLPAMLLRQRIAELYAREPVLVRQAPLIGREEEMAELMRALHQSAERRGSAYYVWGEPGIGKTRLTSEFTRSAALQRVQVARVGCQSHDERRPMSAFVDLVPKLLELPGAIGCSPETMKYLKRLIAHDPRETTLSPDSHEAELLFANIRRSVFDLLDAIATEGRLVVVIEDVHWLDRMSWELVWDMVGWVRERQIVFVVTSREEIPTAPGQSLKRALPVILALRPLHDHESRELIDAVLEGSERKDNATFIEWCVTSAGGSPYYLGELAAHAKWDGHTYQASEDLTRLVKQRLTQLTPIARRLLQVCSIFGKLASVDRLERCLGESRFVLLAAFEELENLGLIYSDGVSVRCKHEILASAAVAQLPTLTLQVLHRHAARVLEEDSTKEHSAVIAWECAEHLERSGDRTRAVTFVRDCARHLLELGLPGEAAEVHERIWTADLERPQILSLLEERVTALHLAERWDTLSDTLEQIERIRQQEGSPLESHSTHELLTIESQWQVGRNIDSCYDHVVACARDTSATNSHRIQSALLTLIFADNLYRKDSVIEVAAIGQLETDAQPHAEVALKTLRLISLCSFGDLSDVPRVAEDLVHAARAHDNAVQVARCLRHASTALEIAGCEAESLQTAEHALRTAEATGARSSIIGAISRLVTLALAKEDASTAAAWLAKAAEIPCQQTMTVSRTAMLVGEIRTLLLFQRYEEAAGLLDDLRRAEHTFATPRGSTQFLALETDIRLRREQWAPTEGFLAELQAKFERCRTFTGHDYVAAVFAEALLAGNQREAAQSLVGEYLDTSRRERSPVLPRLLRMQEQLS
ncbi:MAG TPA: AAA family ATPase [Gemmatimonadaceae bacterium]